MVVASSSSEVIQEKIYQSKASDQIRVGVTKGRKVLRRGVQRVYVVIFELGANLALLVVQCNTCVLDQDAGWVVMLLVREFVATSTIVKHFAAHATDEARLRGAYGTGLGFEARGIIWGEGHRRMWR